MRITKKKHCCKIPESTADVRCAKEEYRTFLLNIAAPIKLSLDSLMKNLPVLVSSNWPTTRSTKFITLGHCWAFSAHYGWLAILFDVYWPSSSCCPACFRRSPRVTQALRSLSVAKTSVRNKRDTCLAEHGASLAITSNTPSSTEAKRVWNNINKETT